MSLTVRGILDQGGLVARRLEHFEHRQEQLELAEAIAHSLRDRKHLLAEAGTGIGKSFAYLVPAILHACREPGAGPVIVSTRTIALQQQLDRKDLPFLHAILPLEWSSVTAVGRNNYVCLRRMHLAHRERGLLFADRERQAELDRIVAWSLTTQEGTRMDLTPPVSPMVWEEVQAEHGNCLNHACPHFDPCPWQRARRRVDGAQILIVNHALYMADVALRMAGATYLPEHRVVVFDEAHHLEQVATEHLGLRVTEATIAWHLRRLHAKNTERSLLLRYGSQRAGFLYHEVLGLSAAFFASLADRLARAGGDATALRDALDPALAELVGDLGSEVVATADGIDEPDRRMEMMARGSGFKTLAKALKMLCTPPAPTNLPTVRWIERSKRGPELCAAPLRIGETLRRMVFGPERTAVLVSATLANGSDPDFGWLRQRLGVHEAATLRLGSPFDYATRVQLVLEEGLPDPTQDPRGFASESQSRVLDHVLANGGCALVLCTSWSYVQSLAILLRGPLDRAGLPLLVQGEVPLALLVERKRAEANSVLIGTDSLWEGIDVPGEALTLVIVTRLPFARPDHPLTQARHQAVRDQGHDPFLECTLPEAVLKFRQGFGRLMRRATDRGRVVILDPRVRTKPYGREFLASLPQGLCRP